MRMLQELVRRYPESTDVQRELSQSFTKLGRIEQDRENPAGAAKNFLQASDILRKLVTGDPENADWQLALSSNLVNLASILAIAALGLQLIVGYTGQFSFGHAAFYGVGAYASTLLVMKLKVPFILALPCAAIAAALAGLLIAPVLRLSGHYLAIATLAVGEIVFVLMINWKALTNGAYGIYGIPLPEIGPLKVDDDPKFFILVTLVLALVYFIAVRLVHSRFGRGLIAVRENELAAIAAGINPLRQKSAAFIYGSASAGVAGALYAHYGSYISPEFFSFNVSVQMVVMVVIGGLGSMPGAIIGALVVVLLPESLRAFADYRLVIYGGLIIVFMLFLPGGLADIGRRAIRFATRRRGGQGAAVRSASAD